MEELAYWLSRAIGFPLRPPRVMQVSLTYRCNLACRMCGIHGLMPKEDELSTRQVFHLADEAASYGIKELLLTGGEPFLRDDLFDICAYARTRGLRTVITTNGILVDEGMARRLAAMPMTHVHFSLDGIEKTNDSLRGEGVFARVKAALGYLRGAPERRCSVGIAFTVMDDNCGELFNAVRFADEMGADVINFQPLVKDNADFSDRALPAFWVKRRNLSVLGEQIARIRAYKPSRVTVLNEPRIELLLPYYAGTLTRKDWVCFGGFKTVFICFDKRRPLAYSCHGTCGDLDITPLKKAWESKEAAALRRHSRECRRPCLQSCYSLEGAQSLARVWRSLKGAR